MVLDRSDDPLGGPVNGRGGINGHIVNFNWFVEVGDAAEYLRLELPSGHVGELVVTKSVVQVPGVDCVDHMVAAEPDPEAHHHFSLMGVDAAVLEHPGIEGAELRVPKLGTERGGLGREEIDSAKDGC